MNAMWEGILAHWAISWWNGIGESGGLSLVVNTLDPTTGILTAHRARPVGSWRGGERQ